MALEPSVSRRSVKLFVKVSQNARCNLTIGSATLLQLTMEDFEKRPKRRWSGVLRRDWFSILVIISSVRSNFLVQHLFRQDLRMGSKGHRIDLTNCEHNKSFHSGLIPFSPK
eukprot:450996-Amphidinium_carterae.1